MVPSPPTGRTFAVFVLLVVGVACSFAFHVALAGSGATYVATPVDPGENATQVADASLNVTDLDEALSGSDAPTDPVDEAAANGSFEGTVRPELSVSLDDVESRYVVYEGDYYVWSKSAREDTTYLRIEMRPVEPNAVLSNVSTPYGEAPAAARTAVDSGAVEGERASSARGVYRKGDTYYAVYPENEAAILLRIVGGFLGLVLTTVGRGYVGAALGLLVVRYRAPSVDRPLTVRRALGVAAVAVPVGLCATALFESGSLSRFLTAPLGAWVVASGVVGGVLAFQRRWLRLVGYTVVVGVVTVVGAGVALGIPGLVFAIPATVVGVVGGVIPFVYGVAFAREEAEATEAEMPSTTPPRE